MFFKALSWCWEQSKDDFTKPILILSVLVILLAITWWIKNSTEEKLSLPPGPWGLPLVGNLPFLDPELHSHFAKLSFRYGPIMKVQLGMKSCIVFSSPEVAKEALKVHDANFADHDVPAVGFVCAYGGIDIGFSPYGENSRRMRRICVSHLLHRHNLEALYGLRRREVRDMVSKVYHLRKSSIDIGEHVAVSMFNIITSMMWGNTLDGEERVHVVANVRQVVQKMVGLLGEANVSDFFPVLARFDLQGKVRQMEEHVKWFDQIFEFVIDKRRKMTSGDGEAKSDFLHELLQLVDQEQRGSPFTPVHIKALLSDMIIAATSTTSTTVEWAIAELLNRPEMLKRAQAELDDVVRLNNMFEESHLPQLPYLDAIVKEVLRLHPAAPFLVPRRAMESCVIGGYLIPKGAKIIVNAWAIQTDPNHWVDPMKFDPERFLNSTIDWDYNGNDFRYLPFGSGRRKCAGIALGEKLVSYLLGSLLHSFNWELPDGTDLDLTEKFGIELKKKIPLVAIATPRLSDTSLY